VSKEQRQSDGTAYDDASMMSELDGDGTKMRRKACESDGTRVIADGKFQPSGISGEIYILLS